ncbi:PH domain-containing protein [Nocardioides mesophilus]|uniref:PH domain-containing protein n=1 Tax=Nocardioides mesophilus TaxID=433659 RepID=A0A7G9R6J4_9ACTN|nr:PH domain-containing protein [Nocardioides mesophilus]QNN51219.1 PH domain-containing protein [Nocardioides mesophilus]
MSEPEPVAPAAAPVGHEPRRLSPMTPLVRGGIYLVALVATTWDDLLAGRLGPIALTLIAVLAAGMVAGYASWLRTKYWIEDDELRIDTGVISHQSRRIRVDRLQGIDIVQPFLARLFGLAELKMDTAGGSREGSLAFLPLAEAHQVRESLLARRDAVRRAAPAGTEPPVPGALPAAQRGWQPPDHDIAALDLRTLVLSSLLSLGTIAAVAGAALLGVAFAFQGMAVVAPMVPVVVGFVLVQLRRLSGYHGFTVSQTSAGLQVRRGLFERTTQTITLARVQGVVVSEPLLWRRLGWAKLDVSVAGYGGGAEAEGGPSATTVMPVAPRAVVLELARHLLRGRPTLPVDDEQGSLQVDPDAVPLTSPPRRARWLDPVGRRFLAAGMGADLVVSRGGWLVRRTHAVRHARVQSLRIRQGPVQRRLGLADLVLDSPPGPVSVRLQHRTQAETRELLEAAVVLGRKARLAALEG